VPTSQSNVEIKIDVIAAHFSFFVKNHNLLSSLVSQFLVTYIMIANDQSLSSLQLRP
jgi:hypothetical protein